MPQSLGPKQALIPVVEAVFQPPLTACLGPTLSIPCEVNGLCGRMGQREYGEYGTVAPLVIVCNRMRPLIVETDVAD